MWLASLQLLCSCKVAVTAASVLHIPAFCVLAGLNHAAAAITLLNVATADDCRLHTGRDEYLLWASCIMHVYMGICHGHRA